MKLKVTVYTLFSVIVLVLITASAQLYKQNIDYRSTNRDLVLQNDSLRAVVIELNKKSMAP